MRVFVANPTLQVHQFDYRVKGQDKLRQLLIQPMSQTVLADDLSIEQFDIIVKQKEKYGFVSVDEISQVKKKRVGLCYSTSGPISSLRIESLFRTGYDALTEQGRTMREQTAIASNDALVRELTNQQRQTGIEADIKNVDIVVQEEEIPNGNSDKLLSEGFKIDSEANNPVAGAPKGRRRRR